MDLLPFREVYWNLSRPKDDCHPEHIQWFFGQFNSNRLLLQSLLSPYASGKNRPYQERVQKRRNSRLNISHDDVKLSRLYPQL